MPEALQRLGWNKVTAGFWASWGFLQHFRSMPLLMNALVWMLKRFIQVGLVLGFFYAKGDSFTTLSKL